MFPHSRLKLTGLDKRYIPSNLRKLLPSKFSHHVRHAETSLQELVEVNSQYWRRACLVGWRNRLDLRLQDVDKFDISLEMR